MTDLLVLDMVDKKLVTDQMVLTIGYDVENLSSEKRQHAYKGEVTIDHYGRKIPKHAHGTANLGVMTSSTQKIMDAVMKLYDRIVNPTLSIRRVTVAAIHLIDERDATKSTSQEYEQLDLFTDHNALERQREAEKAQLAKERKLQEAMLTVKKKYGKNAILMGTNLQEGATAIERNRQIGGRKA